MNAQANPVHPILGGVIRPSLLAGIVSTGSPQQDEPPDRTQPRRRMGDS